MSSSSKTDSVNPYICNNRVLQRRATKQKLIPGALGSKLFAITALISQKREPAQPKEAHGTFEDVSKEARHRIQTSNIPGRWLAKINRGGSRVLPRQQSLNYCTPNDTNPKRKKHHSESNGHTQQITTVDKGLMNQPMPNGECNIATIQADVDSKLKSKNENLEQPEGRNIIEIVTHINTNGIISCTNDLVETDLPEVEYVNGTTLPCKKHDCDSGLIIKSCNHEKQLNGHVKLNAHIMDNTPRNSKHVCQPPVTFHKKENQTPFSHNKSLAERILENRSISGCLLDINTTTEYTIGDNGGSKAAEKTFDGQVGNSETDQRTQSKTESGHDMDTSLLKKHQPDLTPAEGENTCPIVKRRQRKKVIVCQ